MSRSPYISDAQAKRLHTRWLKRLHPDQRKEYWRIEQELKQVRLLFAKNKEESVRLSEREAELYRQLGRIGR